jgi:putative RNA 2'-phosphotransferase
VSKKNRIRTDNLARFLVYILGHRPDEFGLFPDKNGFFTYKELLQAVHEEPGWGYVREGSINEVLSGKDRSLFQSEEKRIKSVVTEWHLDLENPAISLPKILYTGIRTKAHSAVMDKGLHPIEGSYYILSQGRDMAERIGKRCDREPVILEIRADTALREGMLFYTFGDLFITKEILSRHIAGPPVPKNIIKEKEVPTKKKKTIVSEFQPGTFILEADRDLDRSRISKGKKRKGWKEEARKFRRKK